MTLGPLVEENGILGDLAVVLIPAFMPFGAVHSDMGSRESLACSYRGVLVMVLCITSSRMYNVLQLPVCKRP